MAAFDYDVHGGTADSVSFVIRSTAGRMSLDERKEYIQQCRMFLFGKLGAVLTKDFIPQVLYWEPVGKSPPPPHRFPAFSSCVFHRMCDNRGRHRNNVLKSGRWY